MSCFQNEDLGFTQPSAQKITKKTTFSLTTAATDETKRWARAFGSRLLLIRGFLFWFVDEDDLDVP